MTQQVAVEGQAYHDFVKYVTNPYTRVNYISRLKVFLKYCQTHNADELLFNGDIKLVQTRVSDFLIHAQSQGFSSSTITGYLTTIKFFYEMNDVTSLNWKKIARIMKPFRREANDRPYTTSEIAKLLEKCDQRGRVVILLMASSGMREGAIHSIKLAHMERVEDDNIYRIIVYKNDPEEYTALCSPECAKAIDDYLDYRKHYGEILKPSSPLIREQFNKLNPEAAASPHYVKECCIKDIIYRAINDAALREKRNVVKGQKKYLYEVMQSHGLRKYFETQAVGAGMDLFTAELLMGHQNGLPLKSYIKPSLAQLVEKYMQVVDAVTINEEHKLRCKVRELKEENTEISKALVRIDDLYKKLGL
jgi:integrase